MSFNVQFSPGQPGRPERIAHAIGVILAYLVILALAVLLIDGLVYFTRAAL